MLGLGPFGAAGDGTGDGGNGADTTPRPTGTVVTGATGGDEADLPAFSFEIVAIEECGQTCRDVTVTLYNNQNQTATNVSVDTRIFAGNSTAQGDQIWEDTEDIGTMEPGSSVTRTQRVELSFSQAFAVQQNDGWITVVTTVRSDQTTITFENRRNVL